MNLARNISGSSRVGVTPTRAGVIYATLATGLGLRPRIGLHGIATSDLGSKLGPRGHPELGEHMSDVRLNGPARYEKPISDLPVR